MTRWHARKHPRFHLIGRLLGPIGLLAALTVFASNAAADDTRTVKLKVSVIDDKDNDIPGATVIVTPEGGTAVTVQADEHGNAIATVGVAAAKFGEGWMRSAPTLTVVVTKDAMSSQKTLNVKSKDFKDGKTAELICTVVLKAPPPPVVANLTVIVEDEEGKAVSGARVNVHQSATGRFRKGIVVPPDYQELTGTQGIAHLTIKVPAGGALDIGIEVAREDMESQTRDLSLGTSFPTNLPEQEFKMKKRGEAGGTDIISVTVEVKSEGKPLEGASVLIRDQSLGAVSGRFTGVTGVDGKTTIRVWYATPSASEALPIEVSKNGYKMGKGAVTLLQKQIGKTIAGPTIPVEKESKTGTTVTVNVIDKKMNQPIVGAQVTLDGPGYHWDNTNSSGVATFIVPETGMFEVRVSAESYRDFKSQVRVRVAEQDKPPVECYLEPKRTKDEGKDVIEVTVLKKDPTDEKSKPAPLEGAYVKAGSISGATDSSGQMTLQAAFEDKQEVTAEAPGYKSQRKTVALSRTVFTSPGKGRVTFTLDPELSENNPIRIVVRVQNLADEKITDATVEFYSATGQSLGSSLTKDGSAEFKSGDFPNVPLAELRKGISVTVKKSPEYKEVVNRSVPSNLLQPSLQAGDYIVELERDWTALEKALAALEPQAAALKNEAAEATAKAKTAESLIAKFPAAKGRVEEILNELKQAEAAFKPEESKKRCDEAKDLAKQIIEIQKQATQKEEEIKKGLDEAIALAAKCNSKAQADVIKARYREAIKAAGEISKLTRKVAEPREKLARMAEAMKQGGPLKERVEQARKKIESEVETAKKDSATATSAFNDAFAASLAFPNKRAALAGELAKIKTQFDLAKNDKLLPPPLKTRVANLEQLLASITPPKPLGVERLDEVMKPVLAQLDQFMIQARGTARGLEDALCQVDPMDAVVEEINSHVSGATIELSAAADLQAKADECIAKASQSPAPASDEVIVPDVIGLTEPAKMIAAGNQAGLKTSLVASTEPPATNGGGVVVRQNPLANTRAKRGEPLVVWLSQKKVAVATPSPMPTAAVAASPKEIEEVTVPTIPAGVTVAEAKATLSAAGLIAVFNAKGGKPTAQDLEFKTTGAQDVPGGSKAKRGTPVTVSVYQKYEATAAASPTPPPSPPPTLVSGTMPDLTGLTLEQAMARLPAGMRIGSVEMGDKPPKPNLALRIFAQAPAPGTKIDLKKPLAVTVKHYGSTQSTVGTGPERFDGSYSGSYTGADKGAVKFTVANGVIAITSPGRGTGQISQSGAASISGSGADGNSSYTFSGTFSIGSNGQAGAGGTWSGKQYGYNGSGTWSASRR